MKKYSTLLLRVSAIFALAGAFLGSHMAGSGGYEFRSVHAHILVVGWLTLFAWSVYYRLYKPAYQWLAALHVWTAIIGAVGLTVGMYVYYVKPFGLSGAFPTVFFIVGGTIMLISFVCFALLTFSKQKD